MAVKSSVSANHINTNWFGISWIPRKLFWNARNVKKKNEYSLITIPLRRNLIWRINMKPEEAKDILSDMRDQHLQFLSGDYTNSNNEWYTSYLKEAWA